MTRIFLNNLDQLRRKYKTRKESLLKKEFIFMSMLNWVILACWPTTSEKESTVTILILTAIFISNRLIFVYTIANSVLIPASLNKRRKDGRLRWKRCLMWSGNMMMNQ